MVAVVDDDEFVATARIYHRYRLAGFHRLGGETTLKAVDAPLPTQAPLPFTYVLTEAEEQEIDRLITPLDDDIDRLRQDKLRTRAIQEASLFESTLTRRSYARYRGFEEYLARHESLAKVTVRLFSLELSASLVLIYRIRSKFSSSLHIGLKIRSRMFSIRRARTSC